jgi:hypothetical protein
MAWSSPSAQVIGTTAAKLADLPEGSPRRRITLIRQGGGYDGASEYYLGGVDVTPTSGIKIAGMIFGPFEYGQEDLYVVTSSGNVNLVANVES